ncbi:MAG: ketopantoate reductase [Myxococcales bacterium]|nr:ketopantoate reductase [Myxococcales bacterium]
MNMLIVGAGAVGQPYGYHLKQGGASVSFYVRPKVAEEVRRGVVLYPLNRSRRPDPVFFREYDVLSTLEEVAAKKWDAVWLCISSTALRTGWFEEFVRVIGEAVVVSLQPGFEDKEWLLQYVPQQRLVRGMITVISYQAPLEGESWPQPGVAYWFPPLSPLPLSGNANHVKPLVHLLKKGGCAAREHASVGKLSAAPTAILMPHLLALEAAGWSFRRLVRGDRLGLAAKGSREALRVVGRKNGMSTWLAALCTRPLLFRIGLRLLPRFFPFDIETYLKYHFTKVGDQTRMFVRAYIDAAARWGLSNESLRELERQVDLPNPDFSQV